MSAHSFETQKITAVFCHGVAALVDCKLSNDSYLVEGKTITGFANIEEDLTDAFAGQRVMPWRLEDALKERGANSVMGGRFKAFCVRDGQLITGQQQYSGRNGAQMVISALSAPIRTSAPAGEIATANRRLWRGSRAA
jgi:putative intracellular protease/amidase